MKYPPRLFGAPLLDQPGVWAAMSDMRPPDYIAFEFLSVKEHKEILAKERKEAREEGMRAAGLYVALLVR